MKNNELYRILGQVAEGQLSPEEAALLLKKEPFTELEHSMPDHHRALRQGAGEVIFGQGKTASQIKDILGVLTKDGAPVLITRLSPEKAGEINADFPLNYSPEGQIASTGDFPSPDGNGSIVIITGGTSDMPVAEEAAFTAQFLGNKVTRIYDAGVAGLHRLLSRLDSIMTAQVIIAIAGMEGALASVVAGLADCPVIAVPTSVGYGASFGGLSALLSMLNSCASGVSVVNIDNGFGAAYQASLINHSGGKNENSLP